MSSGYKTEQEAFWAGEFGDEYSGRNRGDRMLAANVAMFTRVLDRTQSVNSIIEFGANIGMNLQALRQLIPDGELSAIEINRTAVAELEKRGGIKVYPQSILEFNPDYERDLVLIKGVLIHINPDALPDVYDRLYKSSKRYICVAEYYNPSPVQVSYRGNQDRLFKRDFAGEMLERFSDLRLVDYAFVYHRDNNYPQDDITWFLLEKTGK